MLFVIWVLAPYVAFAWADQRSAQWPAASRAALHTAAIAVALGSLVIYTRVVVRPPTSSAARVFLLVPPAAWLLATIVARVTALVSRGAESE